MVGVGEVGGGGGGGGGERVKEYAERDRPGRGARGKFKEKGW